MYSFTLLVRYMVWRSCSFRQYTFFSNYDGLNAIFPIQQPPCQNFGKVRKSLQCIFNKPSAQCRRREGAVHALRAPRKHSESVERVQRIANENPNRNAIECHANSIATPWWL